MDWSVAPVITYILAWLGIITGIDFLFSKVEDRLSDETKHSISKWLKNLDPVGPVKNWPSQFINIFDSIFGKKHLSFSCFLNSFIVTIASVAFWTLIAISMNPDIVDLQKISLSTILQVGLFTNIIADYISLLETRYVLKKLSDKKSNLIDVSYYLLMDFFYTWIIFTFFGIGFTFIVMTIILLFNDPQFLIDVHTNRTQPDYSFSDVIRFLDFRTTDNVFVVYVYTTFTTSIWTWLYALSGLVVKLAHKLNIGLIWFKGKFDIDQKPLRSMALVSIMIVTIILVVVPFLRLIS